MTPKQLKGWLQWRKQVGLPPVPQQQVNDLLRDKRTFAVEQPHNIQAFRKVTFLWGLIKIYKPIKVK